MKVKDYLYELRISDSQINNKLKELENLKNLAYSLGGTDFEQKVQSSNKSDLSDRVIKVIDFRRELNDDIDKYIDLKSQITKEIDKLKDSEHIDILYKRYIHNNSWRDIAEEMNYSERTIHRIHGKALREFEEINNVGTQCHK